MIANCPSCGTHYKHEPPPVMVRARCGRCDASLDLARLRPYRIVAAAAPSPEDAASAARHLPIGLDHPALATAIAQNVARPQPTSPPPPNPDIWEDADPLPQIPEMARRGAFDSSVPPIAERHKRASVEAVSPGQPNRGTESSGALSPARKGAATFTLWLTAGAIAGTGGSWAMGGTTTAGVAVGAVLGAAAGWGWLRWTSQK